MFSISIGYLGLASKNKLLASLTTKVVEILLKLVNTYLIWSKPVDFYQTSSTSIYIRCICLLCYRICYIIYRHNGLRSMHLTITSSTSKTCVFDPSNTPPQLHHNNHTSSPPKPISLIMQITTRLSSINKWISPINILLIAITVATGK